MKRWSTSLTWSVRHQIIKSRYPCIVAHDFELRPLCTAVSQFAVVYSGLWCDLEQSPVGALDLRHQGRVTSINRHLIFGVVPLNNTAFTSPLLGVLFLLLFLVINSKDNHYNVACGNHRNMGYRTFHTRTGWCNTIVCTRNEVSDAVIYYSAGNIHFCQKQIDKMNIILPISQVSARNGCSAVITCSLHNLLSLLNNLMWVFLAFPLLNIADFFPILC